MGTNDNDPLPSAQQPPRPGRTPSDALVELTTLAVRVFGIGFPFLVVVAGAAYGFIALQEVYQETDRRRTAVLTEVLREIRESYKAIAILNDMQIKAITDTLVIQERVGKSLTDLEAEEEQQVEELRRVQEKLQSARQERAIEIERRDRTEAELATAREDLEKKKADLQRRADGFAKRVSSIAELRIALNDLAQAVKRDLPTTSSSHQLALDAIAQYVIDPVEILTRYAGNPQDKNAIASLQDLAGLSEGRLRELLEDFNGFGFRVWWTDEEPDKVYGFLSAVTLTSNAYENLVFLEEGDGRIVDIEILDQAFATKLFDHRDWSRPIAFYALVLEDGEVDVTNEIVSVENSSWRLDEASDELLDMLLVPLFGADTGVDFLDAEAFATRMRRYPDGQEILSDIYDSPGLNLAMVRAAQKFEEQVLPQVNLDLMPETLKRPFSAFLIAAVARERMTGAILLAPHMGTAVAGRVAAAALRPEFRITEVTPSRRPTTNQQAPSTIEEEPIGFSVRAEFRSGEAPNDFNEVIFEFARREEGRGWLLAKFKGVGL